MTENLVQIPSLSPSLSTANVLIELIITSVANEGKVEAQYIYHTLGSLYVACFSNAMMLAMMWEHFHRAGYVALTREKSE